MKSFKIILFMLLVVGRVTAQQPKYSWIKQETLAYPGKQDDICFVDERNGWYCNGQGKIYHTSNGGINWNLVYEKKGTFFRCIAFLDSLKGFAGNVGTEYFPNVTDTIPLYQTNDGGISWKPVIYTGKYVKGLCAIDLVKEQYINHGNIDYRYHIYAVGRVGSPANIMVSHDNGLTFNAWSMLQDCKMLFDIKMFNVKEGFVCAASNEDITQSNALILYTKDGGVTWVKSYQSARPFETTWKVSFPSRKVGYVTIQSYNPDTLIKQQRIAKTIDGGITWNEINLCKSFSDREFGVGFVNEKIGFVGTITGGYETIDGGLSWQKTEIGRAANKIRIYSFGEKLSLYSIGLNVYHLELNKKLIR